MLILLTDTYPMYVPSFHGELPLSRKQTQVLPNPSCECPRCHLNCEKVIDSVNLSCPSPATEYEELPSARHGMKLTEPKHSKVPAFADMLLRLHAKTGIHTFILVLHQHKRQTL